MLKYLLAATLFLAPVSTQARERVADDGNELLKFCTDTDPDTFYQAMCLGYIRGADATLLLWAGANEATPYCPPSNVTVGQLKDVVVSYLRRNPNIRHESAPLLILKAEIAAWPCNKVRT